MQLRLYREIIAEGGLARFEWPESTLYAADARAPLCRQQRAMELLGHLEIAPAPNSLTRLRRLWIMRVRHPLLEDYYGTLRASRRREKIELLRRLGATVGMVHSLRHGGTGDIVCPAPFPVLRKLRAQIRKHEVFLAVRGQPQPFPALGEEVESLWGAAGGALAGNWQGFPPVRIGERGLMIMDLARAAYSEPLLDLVSQRPGDIGLETTFFWEYFLQGYCATNELPQNGKEKIEALYKLKLLGSLASGIGIKQAREDYRSQWWQEL